VTYYLYVAKIDGDKRSSVQEAAARGAGAFFVSGLLPLVFLPLLFLPSSCDKVHRRGVTRGAGGSLVPVHNSLNNEATGHRGDTTMQQAIYNNISIQQTNQTANTAMRASQAARVLRWVSRKWDLAGVLALMECWR